MREEQRAAVLPIIELGRSFYVTGEDEDQEKLRLRLHAENVGIGPARILDFRVTVDGEPAMTWGAAMDALLRRSADVAYGHSSINGRTVPPGRSIDMFDLHDKSLAGELVVEFDRLGYAACFCSVFNECWTTSYENFGVSEPADRCERSENSFRE